ncbi:MAG: hypothetical protein JKY94_10030 [Rhodobacteraceae bacterium]|nr:hypothetical protein [Paracoccaceae bacterium]
MALDTGGPVTTQKARAEKVWQKRGVWDGYIKDAYDYALPHRLSGGQAPSGAATDKLFDMTAPMGAMYFAGNLQKDLFPPASSKFSFAPGPLLQARMPAKELIVAERMLQGISKRIDPFFQAGDFDTAANEACWDLGIGTGAIMPVRGDKHQPLFFINIPFQNLACEADAWGRNHFISWRQTLTVEAIHKGFLETGKFSEDFLEAVKNKPNTEVQFYQDFFKVDGGWKWVGYADKYCDEFIVEVKTRTQPLAVGRYYRAPGEPYGRGPILMALPAIKTLNKAQELALRSAAVQLLGIWGYRSGGTFNPDMVNLGPGEFWPMMSTGGQFGADVQRLDPATARLDVANMVIEGMRDDIKGVLMDNRITDDGSTPPSARQIVAILQDRADANIGAYGRLSREFMPVLAPRAAEILFEQGFLDMPLQMNELLLSVKVRSPMQTALDARQLESTMTYFDMVAAVAGPENVDEHFNRDVALKDARDVLDLEEDIAPTETQRKKIRADKVEAQTMLQTMQFGLEAAKVMPDQAQGVI